jgi:hypothetical protein
MSSAGISMSIDLMTLERNSSMPPSEAVETKRFGGRMQIGAIYKQCDFFGGT